eukprot:s426_g10.t1
MQALIKHAEELTSWALSSERSEGRRETGLRVAPGTDGTDGTEPVREAVRVTFEETEPLEPLNPLDGELEKKFSKLLKTLRERLLSLMFADVFDNVDRRMPIDKDEVRVRRTIGAKKEHSHHDLTGRIGHLFLQSVHYQLMEMNISGHFQQMDDYSLDGKTATRNEVFNLLESCGFTKSNPYYIVQQGKVAELTLMDDRRRLELLKEWSIFRGAETAVRRKKTDEIIEGTVRFPCVHDAGLAINTLLLVYALVGLLLVCRLVKLVMDLRHQKQQEAAELCSICLSPIGHGQPRARTTACTVGGVRRTKSASPAPTAGANSPQL